MPRRVHHSPHVSRPCGIDLYDYSRLPESKPRGRPVADDLSDWRVTDDWPEDVPVTPEEVDVFEAWFGGILEELFGLSDAQALYADREEQT